VSPRIRRHVAREAAHDVLDVGEYAVIRGGLRYHLRTDPGPATVVTVTSAQEGALSNRARRMRRRLRCAT